MKKNYYLLVSICILTYGFATAQPTQPSAPISCNSGNCTAALSETCTGGSTVITSFTGATLRSGSPTTLPALYTFYNVASVGGVQINATVTIDGQSNCSMSGSGFSIDDDGAVDQANNSIASFFAPRITPAGNLTTSDARGYVQFTIRFYVENGSAGQQYPGDYTTLPSLGGLSGLNYIHYDIDGTTAGSGGWFRETGVIKDVSGAVINANSPTELVSYTYADGGNWKGFAGSTCERDAVSRCAQVAVAANYALPQTQITVRMGYDYNYNGTSFNSQPTRQYGSRFGCFAFPQQIGLPVMLLTFSGAYRNQHTLLNWSTESEQNFDHFVVERSSNGLDFAAIGNQAAKGNGRADYKQDDDLSAAGGNVFYYRLKMVDKDGQYTYSQVVLIRKDSKIINGITINPNPVTNGMATVKMTATDHTTIELRVIDLNGRILMKQTQNVYEGNNAITVNVEKLQPGIYTIQMVNGDAIVAAKFSIVH